MADFDVNTITVQGAIAIASATAGDKLVIEGCDATTQVLTKAQAVQIGTRPVSPDSTTTSIALAGSTDNHVYAYASFIKGATGQPGGDVHSFFLYGHMESTPSSIVVIAIASATDDIHLPTSSDVTNRTEIQFELTFSATDEVVTVTDTSMYTTRGEFLLLKNRTVTTHAEGAATTGEDQSIYGDKNFVDTLSLNDAYKMQATVTTSSGTTTEAMMFTPKTDYGKGSFVMTNRERNGSTYLSSLMSVGAGSGLNFGESAIFTASHVASSNKSTASMVASGGFDQTSAGVLVERTGITLFTTTDGSVATRTSIAVSGSGIVPSENAELNLGSLSKFWATIYSEGVVCERVAVYSSGTQYLLLDDTGIFPHDSDMNLGGNNSTWGTIFVNDIALGGSNGREIYYDDNSDDIYISTDLVPEDTSNYELGSSDHTWLTVYTEAISLSNTRTICLNSDDDIQINGPLVPDANASHSIGSSDYRFGSVWASSVIANNITSNGGDEFMVGANNTPCYSWLHFDINTTPCFAELLMKDGEGEEVQFYFDRGVFYADSTSDEVALGSSAHSWGELHCGPITASSYSGLLPRPSANSIVRDKPPIGTVFLACIEKDGSSSVTVMYPGTEITPSNQNPDAVAIYYGELVTGPADSGGYRGIFVKGTLIGHPSTAQYILMSQADFNNTTYAFAFVQVKSIS